MSAAQSIAGRVVCQQDGRPVPYATVQALVQGRGGVKRSTASQTDAAGRFSLIVPGFEVAGQRPAAVFVDVEFEGELVGRSRGIAAGSGDVELEVACAMDAAKLDGARRINWTDGQLGLQSVPANDREQRATEVWSMRSHLGGASTASPALPPIADLPHAPLAAVPKYPPWLAKAVATLIDARPILAPVLDSPASTLGAP